MSDIRFSGAVDHLAVKTDDLQRDVEEYKRIGFSVESLFDDWAMMRDSRGFGIALLPPNSKHPPQKKIVRPKHTAIKRFRFIQKASAETSSNSSTIRRISANKSLKRVKVKMRKSLIFK